MSASWSHEIICLAPSYNTHLDGEGSGGTYSEAELGPPPGPSKWWLWGKHVFGNLGLTPSRHPPGKV